MIYSSVDDPSNVNNDTTIKSINAESVIYHVLEDPSNTNNESSDVESAVIYSDPDKSVNAEYSLVDDPVSFFSNNLVKIVLSHFFLLGYSQSAFSY